MFVLGNVIKPQGLEPLQFPTKFRSPSIPLHGTDGARGVFWSPDGQWVGFQADGVLKKVALAGGAAETLTPAGGPAFGASWGEDDVIVFGTGPAASPLRRVSAFGGEALPVTTLDADQGEQAHLWPQILPAGHAVVFTVWHGDPQQNEIAVQRFSEEEHRVLLKGTSGRYVPTGHLVFAREATLWTAPFDADSLDVTGPASPVLEGVRMTVGGGAAQFTFSRDGSLAYVPGGGTAAERSLVWVDREGREEPINAPPRPYVRPRLSPDGTRVAVDLADQEGDIWVWDFARQTFTRLTFDPAADTFPVWTPDGQRLIFTSQRGGLPNPYWQAADGTGAAERLVEDQNPLAPYALSPDGRWIAYDSDETGRGEVYVRPFPDVEGGRWQISTAGGREAIWARSGRELFYYTPEGMVMSVPVQSGPSFTFGNASVLVERVYFSGAPGHNYDASPDGQRFLMIKLGDETSTPGQVIVVQNRLDETRPARARAVIRNEFEELKARVCQLTHATAARHLARPLPDRRPARRRRDGRETM